MYGSFLYGTGQGTALSSYKDGAERAVPQPQSPNVTPISSDNEFQWPQIGVGILIALVLVLGHRAGRPDEPHAARTLNSQKRVTSDPHTRRPPTKAVFACAAVYFGRCRRASVRIG